MRQSKPTDLSFLENLRPTLSRDMRIRRKFKGVIWCLKKGWTTDRTAKHVKLSAFTVNKFRAELKEAFKNGFKDLESYLEAGRPCNPGNKVIA